MHEPPSPYGASPVPPRTGMSRRRKIVVFGGGTMVGLFAFFWAVGVAAGPPPEKQPAAVVAPSSTTPEPAPTIPAPAPVRPTATPSPPRPDATTRAPAVPVASSSPNPGQQAAYLATLGRIHPGLTVDTDRIMRRSVRVCERIQKPPGGTLTLTRYVVLELSGGNATINETQAAAVVRAVKVWCR